jgi:hypothetical protein
MAAQKKKSLKAQKARKQKTILIVGGALLVVVLAIQAPRIMKMVHGGGTESTAAPYKAFPDAVLHAGNPADVEVSNSGTVVLPDADADPEPGAGQLVDFALFPSKDPFVQQVKEREDGVGAPGVPDAPAKSGGAGNEASTGGSESGAAGGGGGDIQLEEAAPTSATISVNGASESVQVGGKFPSDDPTFVLVSATNSSAKIGIAGGSLASGGQTVTLRRGHTLTLVNTVDGTEYHLTLLAPK